MDKDGLLTFGIIALAAFTTATLGVAAHSNMVEFRYSLIEDAAAGVFYAWCLLWAFAGYSFFSDKVRQRDERLREEGRKEERKKWEEGNRRRRDPLSGSESKSRNMSDLFETKRSRKPR
jgi:hypothetical protein